MVMAKLSLGYSISKEALIRPQESDEIAETSGSFNSGSRIPLK